MTWARGHTHRFTYEKGKTPLNKLRQSDSQHCKRCARRRCRVSQSTQNMRPTLTATGPRNEAAMFVRSLLVSSPARICFSQILLSMKPWWETALCYKGQVRLCVVILNCWVKSGSRSTLGHYQTVQVIQSILIKRNVDTFYAVNWHPTVKLSTIPVVFC